MPQIQSIYNGNFVVWQRKVAEVVVDLKSDIVNLQKFGVVLGESTFFNTTATLGIHVTVEIASHASPNVWNLVYSAPLASGSWVPHIDNMVPPDNGVWVENQYVFNNGATVVARYVRFRIAANSSDTPLQTVALKKVILTNSLDVSLAIGASVQVNVLGWQTGTVLKDILEDLLDNRILATTLQDEVVNARTSPKGTWDPTSEQYVAPAPRIFATLKGRLDDLEQDAERRLSARKVMVPVEDVVNGIITDSVIQTNIQADATFRKVYEYLDSKDLVDILVQETEGVGKFEEPMRTNDGVLVIGKVTYGMDTTGYTPGNNAMITLHRTDTDAIYSLPTNRTIKLIVPVETDLWHMDRYDITRSQFSTSVIQDIGILNELDLVRAQLNAAVTSDSLNQALVVYEQSGIYYADLVFPSNATGASEWVVLKNGLPAIPTVDYSFINSQKIRLDTHDNFAPTGWQVAYFTNNKANLDEKINEIIEAVARLTVTILNLSTNIDEINDALVEDWHTELIQLDYRGNDGFDYFKPLTYKVRDIDNASAIMYQNATSIGAKDTTWVFRGDGIVALHRASVPFNPTSEYSIKYYFKKYDHLVDKIKDMTRTSDRDLIVRNWNKTNPVPPEADSDTIKLI